MAGKQQTYDETTGSRFGADLMRTFREGMAAEDLRARSMGHRFLVAAEQAQRPWVCVEWCAEFCGGRRPAVVIVEDEWWVEDMRLLAARWEFVVMAGARTVALIPQLGPGSDVWERNGDLFRSEESRDDGSGEA